MLKTSLRKNKKRATTTTTTTAAAAAASLNRSLHNKHWPANPTALPICVLLTVKERAHSAPDVTWACAWCLVSQNITQK